MKSENDCQTGARGRGSSVPSVIVLTRFRVPAADPAAVAELRAGLARAVEVLAAQPGYLWSEIGRNVDDADLWVLATGWQHVGAYRRALSSYDAKLHAWPTLTRALDEPSAYEPAGPGEELNADLPRVT
jgi:quinol monooxygenase YgiN